MLHNAYSNKILLLEDILYLFYLTDDWIKQGIRK